ncbi:MAG: sulfite exporter TauE/SafE family protein [Burkholderiaceae bacterium]
MIEALVPAELGTSWAVVLVCLSFVSSAFTAAFGIGGGVAMITVMLMALPPAVVLPLHGIVQTGSNAGRAFVMRAHVSRPILGLFALGSVVGVLIASSIIFALPAPLLQAILGAFILWSLWTPKLHVSRIPLAGFLAVGAGATFSTMFLGATGPLVAAFWDVGRLGRNGVVANHAACLTVQHLLKVVAFGALGFAFAPWIPLLAAMVAVGFLGTLAGKRVLARLPEKIFAMAFRLVLSALAVRLLWVAWQSWPSAS